MNSQRRVQGKAEPYSWVSYPVSAWPYGLLLLPEKKLLHVFGLYEQNRQMDPSRDAYRVVFRRTIATIFLSTLCIIFQTVYQKFDIGMFSGQEQLTDVEY
jgi:hypothetical protein